MSKVLAAITMSMDGYIAGPNDRVGAGLGDDGERLHYWMFGDPSTDGKAARGGPAEVDRAYLDELFSSGGAWIVGRTMHDLADGWGDDPGFGVPVFVVTHRERETDVKGDTTFTFVTGGLDEALRLAREAAGEKNVIVMGGADVLRQCLDAGIVDELALTIAPILLGSGKRLFDGIAATDLRFEPAAVIGSPAATHIRYRVRSAASTIAR
jgi:dihydrofolate reductase